jgi:hypothetical protein
MLEDKGMHAVQRGNFTGDCYSYIDSTKQLGVCSNFWHRINFGSCSNLILHPFMYLQNFR